MDVSNPAPGKQIASPDGPTLPPLTPPLLPKDSSHSPASTATPCHGQVRQGRGFAVVAKRVIQEERKRKEEEKDRVEQEGEMITDTNVRSNTHIMTKVYTGICD